MPTGSKTVPVSVTFDWSSCVGVEPFFVFDMQTGQFLVDVAMSQWLIERDLKEQRISLATATRCLERIRKLAWRMGTFGGPAAADSRTERSEASTVRRVAAAA